MKTMEFKQFGGPEQLLEADVPKPQAKPGQVVVHVCATSYNPMDRKVASGQMRETPPTQMPFVPGVDFSGTIDSLGADVQGFVIGDEVFGFSRGGGAYAQFMAIDADRMARKPSKVSHGEATSLATVAETATQALEQAHLQSGQTILIQGAGGAVGSVAVQLAHHMGVRVIASADAASRERLLGYGADEVIDYKTTRFESVAKNVDVVLDGIGGDTQERSFAVLKPGGMLVALTQPPSQELAAQHKVSAWMLDLNANVSTDSLQALATQIDAGQIRPFVGRTYPLHEAAQAWTDVQAGHIEGKIVFTVS